MLGNDIIEINTAYTSEIGVSMVLLLELLARSDYISLICDLNPSSRHMINAKVLELVNPVAVIINTARGLIIEEKALLTALQSGKLRGAALDVFGEEPLPVDTPFLEMDQVMLSPHNANKSPTA